MADVSLGFPVVSATCSRGSGATGWTGLEPGSQLSIESTPDTVTFSQAGLTETYRATDGLLTTRGSQITGQGIASTIRACASGLPKPVQRSLRQLAARVAQFR